VNIAVCDDMSNERQVVCDALKKIFSMRNEKVNIVEYSAGENLISDIEEDFEQFDIIFQDIYMKHITGIETATILRNMGCVSKIIFLTSSPDFAIESYDVEASGYLLKPLDTEKLKTLLERILAPSVRKRIAVDYDGRYQYIFLDEIMWVESKNHNVEIHKINDKVLELRKKLSDIEQIINDEDFIRCHQSYLVNMNYVDKFDDYFHMRNGAVIPVRVRSRKQICEQYHKWYLDKF
jgi:DNA-binding LytR/AlgR family response regulator